MVAHLDQDHAEAVIVDRVVNPLLLLVGEAPGWGVKVLHCIHGGYQPVLGPREYCAHEPPCVVGLRRSTGPDRAEVMDPGVGPDDAHDVEVLSVLLPDDEEANPPGGRVDLGLVCHR